MLRPVPTAIRRATVGGDKRTEARKAGRFKPELATDSKCLSRPRFFNGSQNFGNKRQQITKAVRTSDQYHNTKGQPLDILLMHKVLIDCNENVDISRRMAKEFTILVSSPP